MLLLMRYFPIFSFLAAIACVTTASDVPLFPPSQTIRDVAEYSAVGKRGMVATAHHLASEAGARMLAAGGNAMDAAVASSFVISVVRPQSTGIGGGGFLLFHEARTQKTHVFDFRERAPKAATRDMYLDKEGNPKPYRSQKIAIPNASVNGHLAVATPGLVAGLVQVHKSHGKLPLSQVMQPAIDIAGKGFPVYESLAEAAADRAEVLKQFAAARDLFLPAGSAIKVGDILVQKELAWTLKQIAERGRDGFYKGEVARRILAEIKRGGGILSQQDLDAYQVLERQVAHGTYRDHRIVSMPPPSSGGVHIVQMLNMLESYDVKKFGFGTPDGIHILTEVMRRAFADRAKYLGDPDFVEIPVAGLTSKAYAKQLSATINLQSATPSKALAASDPKAFESPSTTHLSVVDQDGNAVASTQTINYSFGSCVVAAGTGIVLNDEMDDFSIKPGVPNAYGLVGSEANAVAARKTPLSSMSPTMVFDKSGKLQLVAGSPGGPRIITATLQTIINVIDHRMALPQAVQAHRIHHQWLPDKLRIEENGFSQKTIDELRRRGHDIVQQGAIGDVQAIARTQEGTHWIGVSDTRSEGKPVGL